MAELTLKDESVLQIGKSVANSFEGLASSGKAMLLGPTGQPLNNSSSVGGPEEDSGMEKPASIGIFESIREKIGFEPFSRRKNRRFRGKFTVRCIC